MEIDYAICAGLCFIGACAFYAYLTQLLVEKITGSVSYSIYYDNGEEEE